MSFFTEKGNNYLSEVNLIKLGLKFNRIQGSGARLTSS